jgi:tryptophan 2,3-dioxygenase
MLKGPKGGTSPALDQVEQELKRLPSLKHALYEWLARTPIDGSSDPEHVDKYIATFLTAYETQSNTLLARATEVAKTERDKELLATRYQRDIDSSRAFLTANDRPNLDDAGRARLRHVRAALLFIELHRELPRLAWPREVVSTMIDLEQKMIVWRQRHARMVERIIGRRTGTGGSDGVDYLDATALRYRVFDELWAIQAILLKSELAPSLAHEEDYRFRIED